MKVLANCALVLAVFTLLARAQSIDECLQKDSISCVQRSLYKRVKEFFEKEKLELVSGVSLVRTKGEDNTQGRSGKVMAYEEQIDEAADVTQRQNALENFVSEEVTDFFVGRSLQINFAPAFGKIIQSARAFSEGIPSEVRQAVDEVVEGRGRKKIMRTVWPLLLAAKLKLGVLATLAYFAIALLAKKAILASIISIAISAFVSLRALWANKSAGHDTTAYNAAGWSSGASVLSAGWSPPIAASSGWASSGWDDAHGAYSAPSPSFTGYHR